jgi:hypothetical protein
MFLTHIAASVGNVSVVISNDVPPTLHQYATEAMLEIIDFLEFEVDSDVHQQIKDTVLEYLNRAITAQE